MYDLLKNINLNDYDDETQMFYVQEADAVDSAIDSIMLQASNADVPLFVDDDITLASSEFLFWHHDQPNAFLKVSRYENKFVAGRNLGNELNITDDKTFDNLQDALTFLKG